MMAVRKFAEQYPVLSFIVLCYGITWPIWFSVPLVAGTDWALGKIVTGAGFGPALAVIILDHLRGSGGKFGTRRWRTGFAVVFLVVGIIDISILLTGDAIRASEFSNAQAPGLTMTGVISSLVGASVAGFIFASLACSRSRTLASIVKWRPPLRWWLVALLLPTGWMLLGLGITLFRGDPIGPVTAGLPTVTWALFVLRSILFTLLVVAIGEEAGWRGWMLPALQQRFSPLLSSALIGIVWGLWHFPLYINGQYADDSVLVFAKVGVCIILGTLFTWLYNRSGGSLLLAVLFHTALNNTPRLIPVTEAMGVGLFAVLITVIITDRMWRRRESIGITTID